MSTTAPVTDPTSPAASAAPAEDKTPLLDVLHDLGSTLVQSEIPASSQLGQIVGAIVKVLDHAGVTVADDLYPAEAVTPARPETAQVALTQKTSEHEDRLDRLEQLLERVIGHVGNSSDSPPEDEPS